MPDVMLEPQDMTSQLLQPRPPPSRGVPMTPQEVFDKVKTHLLTQNATSVDGVFCRYRASNGMKCAVGCLIADEHYTSGLEKKTVEDSFVLEALIASGISGMSYGLLTDLQRVHDLSEPQDWLTELTRVATKHGLTFGQ